ncbi:type II toxin-antitoxin system HicB family antitoxin [Breznakiellaceae bacterium SP9]
MSYIYPACFYPEENEQYSVIFPDLDGIATYGNDLEDAIRMASDLLCVWILESQRSKTALAPPSNIKDVSLDDKNAFIKLITADLDAYTKKNGRPVKKTLTIPA